MTSAGRPSKPRRTSELADDALAAAPDDHTFYVEYNTIPVTLSSQIRIYAFSITSSGSATPMTPVKGGTFVGRSQIAAGSLARLSRRLGTGADCGPQPATVRLRGLF